MSNTMRRQEAVHICTSIIRTASCRRIVLLIRSLVCFHISNSLGIPRFLLGIGVLRYSNCRQNRDDRDHHQEFNERKASFSFLHRFLVLLHHTTPETVTATASSLPGSALTPQLSVNSS